MICFNGCVWVFWGFYLCVFFNNYFYVACVSDHTKADALNEEKSVKVSSDTWWVTAANVSLSPIISEPEMGECWTGSGRVRATAVQRERWWSCDPRRL